MRKSISCLIITSLTLAFLLVPMALNAFAQEPTLKMVSNGDLRSVLIVDGKKIDISGRTSIFFEATERDFNAGRLTAKGINIAYFQVPQEVLTYDKVDPERKGALGFALAPAEGPQYITYDPKSRSLRAKLVGYLDADVMADLAGNPYKDDDYVETPKQKAEISFSMVLQELLIFKDTGEEIIKQEGKVAFDLKAYEDFRSNAAEYQIAQEYTLVAVETSIFWKFEIAKRLKIQPVRIGKFKFLKPYGIFFASYTGAGLNFGLPQLKEQWAKADVIFTINDWVTVWDSSFWIFDSSESTSLKNKVNVDDAVEVFFVYDFSPESMWGGGATWGLGLASSKIISSDGNARGGIDFTHLAHEVGHAIGLPHPDGSPGVSTNTLLCPSGWMNDNPQINSQENKNNVTNPLFTFSFKWKGAGPDCTNSADCGACP